MLTSVARRISHENLGRFSCYSLRQLPLKLPFPVWYSCWKAETLTSQDTKWSARGLSRSTESSVASSPPRTSPRRPSTAWGSSLPTRLSPNPGKIFNMFCVHSNKSIIFEFTSFIRVVSCYFKLKPWPFNSITVCLFNKIIMVAVQLI